MKKTLILAVILLAFSKISFAQTSKIDSLKQYVGNYVFKDGSPVSTYKVTLEGDVIMGEADSFGANKLLKQSGVDTYKSTSSYGSVFTFIRNADKKVVGFKMVIQGNDLFADKKD